MNGQANNCQLSLFDIYTKNVEFNRKCNYIEENLEIEFSINTENNISEDLTEAELSTTIELNDINNLINLRVTMVGIFGVKNIGKLNKQMRKNLLQVNTLAIVFPYIRSYITNITANSGIKPIILPPVNINEVVAQINNK